MLDDLLEFGDQRKGGFHFSHRAAATQGPEWVAFAA
jgi:hypothetical protein